MQHTTAPILRVPHELLSNILELTIEPVEELTICSLDSSAAPWTYTSVSKHFRAVACQTSAIWSSIYIPALAGPTHKDDPARAPYVQTMLRRLATQVMLARRQPLKICIELYEQSSLDITLTLPILWSRRENWEKLIIHGFYKDAPALSRFLPDTGTASFPRLKYLSTPATDDDKRLWVLFVFDQGIWYESNNRQRTVGRYQDNMRVFRNAPNLTFMELGPTPRLLDEGSTYPWTWTRCSHVVFHCLIAQDAAKILPLMDEVETLSIEYDQFGTSSFSDPMPPCFTHCLTTLSITGYEHETLAALVAPALVDLTLTFLDEGSVSEWCSFIERSSCRLLSLHIDHCGARDYAPLLTVVPDLLVLQIGIRDPSSHGCTENLTETLGRLDRMGGQGMAVDGEPLYISRHVPHLLRAWVILDRCIKQLDDLLEESTRRVSQLVSMRAHWTRVLASCSASFQESLVSKKEAGFSLMSDAWVDDMPYEHRSEQPCLAFDAQVTLTVRWDKDGEEDMVDDDDDNDEDPFRA